MIEALRRHLDERYARVKVAFSEYKQASELTKNQEDKLTSLNTSSTAILTGRDFQ